MHESFLNISHYGVSIVHLWNRLHCTWEKIGCDRVIWGINCTLLFSWIARHSQAGWGVCMTWCECNSRLAYNSDQGHEMEQVWIEKCKGITLRSRQNGRQFANYVFICIVWNCYIFIWNSLEFVFKGPTNDKSSLVQIMTWCKIRNKPLFELMMAWFTDAYGCQSALMDWH